MSMHKKFPSIVYTRIILFGKPFYRYIIRIVLGDNGSVMMSGTIFHCKIQRPEESMPGWAFRFLQGVPGVTMVLSGMSSLEQLRANLDTFETDRPLSEAEKAALLDVAAGMVREQVLPCTACRYCVDHCPRHLDIPGLLALYNEHTFTGGGFIENVPRMIPDGLAAHINLGSWPVLPIFDVLEKAGEVDHMEMFNIFNMGIGMVLAVNAEDADKTMELLKSNDEAGYVLGNIVKKTDSDVELQ